MAPKHELRALLEQSCQMVEELSGDAVKLVVDVQAVHYWTTHALETGRQLKNIGANLRSLLTAVEPLFATPDKVYDDPTGQKLIRTIFGLWRALPSLTAKYVEQLARRRRQRIMGIEPEDVGEVPAEQIEQEAAELRQLQEQLGMLYGELKIMAGKLPREIVVEVAAAGPDSATPPPPAPVAPPSAPTAPPAKPPPAAKPLSDDEVLPV